MKTGKNPWDEEYQHRGRLWGGSIPARPPGTGSLNILELGCGNGKTAASLAGAGYRVTAVDFSLRAAALCRKTCPDPDRIRVIVADILTTPFRRDSFDTVMASHVAGHLPARERQQLAGEVHRILAPEGTFLFRDFSCSDFRYGTGDLTEEGTFLRKNGIATHYFTENEVQTLFCDFAVQSLGEQQWTMRVRGTRLPRAEIVAEFRKPARP